MNNKSLITAPIPTHKECSTESAPDVIEITISEVDRQTADAYGKTRGCLICTALRNRGINAGQVGGYDVEIEGCDYEPEDEDTFSPEWLHYKPSTTAPFYGPEVVGKVIRMRKRFPDEGKKAKE